MGMQPSLPVTVLLEKIKRAACQCYCDGGRVVCCEQTLAPPWRSHCTSVTSFRSSFNIDQQLKDTWSEVTFPGKTMSLMSLLSFLSSVGVVSNIAAILRNVSRSDTCTNTKQDNSISTQNSSFKIRQVKYLELTIAISYVGLGGTSEQLLTFWQVFEWCHPRLKILTFVNCKMLLESKLYMYKGGGIEEWNKTAEIHVSEPLATNILLGVNVRSRS